MDNHFNLIDEKWIPIKGKEKASLMDVFTDTSLEAIGGTIIHQFAIIKLLLAIAQRACTPEDDDEWEDLGESGLSSKCVEYLKSHYDLFYLYGDKPFLQFPDLLKDTELLENKTKEKSFLDVSIPDIPSDNTSLLSYYQISKKLDDADKALFIVSIMNYSLGGKRIKQSQLLTNRYSEIESKTPQPGPSLGKKGYLQTCFIGESVLNTIYLNLLSKETINSIKKFSNKEIIPPWEIMPKKEDDEIANSIKEGYMGTLCGLSRFVLLHNNGIIYTNGIQYPTLKEEYLELFFTLDPEFFTTRDSDKKKAEFVDTTKKPWRNITTLMAFSFSTSNENNKSCLLIDNCFRRNRRKVERFGILSGGLRIQEKSGEQYLKQESDFLYESIFFESRNLTDAWYVYLKKEISELVKLSETVSASVERFYKQLHYSEESAKKHSEKASQLFWDLCNSNKDDLIQECKNGATLTKQRRIFGEYAEHAYSHFCSKTTSKQLLAWINNKPNISWYINAKEVD